METVFVLQSLYWDRMMWWNIRIRHPTWLLIRGCLPLPSSSEGTRDFPVSQKYVEKANQEYRAFYDKKRGYLIG